MRDIAAIALTTVVTCALLVVLPLYLIDPGMFYQRAPFGIRSVYSSTPCMSSRFNDTCRAMVLAEIQAECFPPPPRQIQRCFVKNYLTGEWVRKEWLDTASIYAGTY